MQRSVSEIMCSKSSVQFLSRPSSSLSHCALDGYGNHTLASPQNATDQIIAIPYIICVSRHKA